MKSFIASSLILCTSALAVSSVAAVSCVSEPNHSLCKPVYDCIKDASNSACQNVIFPEDMALASANLLCKDMPFMIGCSIYAQCKQGKATGKYCQTFSIAMDVCTADAGMETMNGCENIIGFCSKNSVAKHCKDAGALPKIIQTMDTVAANNARCKLDANLPGCEFIKKGSSKDHLKALTTFCRSNGDHANCKSWKEMCSGIPSEISVIC